MAKQTNAALYTTRGTKEIDTKTTDVFFLCCRILRPLR